MGHLIPRPRGRNRSGAHPVSSSEASRIASTLGRRRFMDRRKFLRVSGVSLGAGALYALAPGLAGDVEGAETARRLGDKNGERPTPFTVFQLSDTHVGWDGALGTK